MTVMLLGIKLIKHLQSEKVILVVINEELIRRSYCFSYISLQSCKCHCHAL